MKLRSYQLESVQSIFTYFENNSGNPVIALPTGTGKSLVIAGFIQEVYKHYPNQRIMVLTHVKELIQQNHEKLITLWPNAPTGIYSAGLNQKDRFSSVTFGGIGSVGKKADLFGHVDLILIDECHLVSPNDSTMYRRFIEDLTTVNPFLKVIGFTATPYRLSQGMIIEEGSLFTDICCDYTSIEKFNWLVDQGYLMPLRPKNPNLVLDTSSVKTRGGDFANNELQEAVDQTELTYSACKEAIELGHDRKSWIVFTAGVEHALHTAEMLCELGIEAKAIHGGNKEYPMTSDERDQAILDYKSGKIRALVNNNILTTGFDHPPLDLIIMLRPTKSPGLWVQMLGRGTRPDYAHGYDLTTVEGRLLAIENSEKQDCLVLDFAGNTQRLGPINDPVLPPRKGKKKGAGEAPVKLCEGEGCASWIHAGAKVCPHCGHEFPFQTKLKNQASTNELIKSDAPVVETFEVSHLTYTIHKAPSKPTMVKITYYSKLKRFTSYLCPEHVGFAYNKSRKLWRERSDTEMPVSASECLNKTSELDVPTHIRVWINKKYPEIMAYCYDGTDFNTKPANDIKPVAKTISDKKHDWKDRYSKTITPISD